MFQRGSHFVKLYSFTEQRKSEIKGSLKYTGQNIRQAATEVACPWASDAIWWHFSFQVGGSSWSLKLIGLFQKTLIYYYHRMVVPTQNWVRNGSSRWENWPSDLQHPNLSHLCSLLSEYLGVTFPEFSFTPKLEPDSAFYKGSTCRCHHHFLFLDRRSGEFVLGIVEKMSLEVDSRECCPILSNILYAT